MQQAADHCSNRVDAQMHKVGEFTQTLIAKQATTRQRLAVMRSGLAGIADDLDTTEAKFCADLAKLRDSLKSQFTASVAAIHQSEDNLRKKVMPAVHAVNTSSAERSTKLQHFMESSVVPRLDHDAAQFATRVAALAQHLETGLERAHQATSASAASHLKQFLATSATNWKGQNGSVEDDANHRAATLSAIGHEQGDALKRQTTRLTQAAAAFSTTMNSVDSRYAAIEGLPGNIEAILRQHGY